MASKWLVGIGTVGLLIAAAVAVVADPRAYVGNREGTGGLAPTVNSCGRDPSEYVGPSTVVSRDANTGQTTADEGTLACNPEGPNEGGGFIPFGAGNSILVQDDARGLDVAFQVCLDNDADGDCHPGDDVADPCRDDIFYSHADDGTFHNPLGPLPTSFPVAAGCPSFHPFEGYVVFVCAGAHTDGGGAHEHDVTQGTISLTTGGTGFGSFCGVPPPPQHAGPGVKEYTVVEFDNLAGVGCESSERGIGAVCFVAGHLQPNLLGQASLTINDDVNNPALGTYCQDLNDDTWCGGNPAIVPPAPYGRDPITGSRGEPSFVFCGSATIQEPISLSYKLEEQWADPVNFGGNWDPTSNVYVLLHGPSQGNAAYAPCGLSFTAFGTGGFVVH